jgi:hypothetical protein
VIQLFCDFRYFELRHHHSPSMPIDRKAAPGLSKRGAKGRLAYNAAVSSSNGVIGAKGGGHAKIQLSRRPTTQSSKLTLRESAPLAEPSRL